jgi:vacuolar iron transporter family protein
MSTSVHNRSSLDGSATSRDILIGMTDGLIVPFALAAGLSAAVNSVSIVVIAGLVQIGAGAITMGLGGYHAAKPEQDHHHGEELPSGKDEADPGNLKEMADTKAFYANLGLGEDLQQQAMEEVAKDKDQWAALMTKYKSGSDHDALKAKKSGINIAASYIIAGLIPLSPYFFMEVPLDALRMSAPLTLICLFVFGFIKNRMAGLNPWTGALRLTVVGAMAAAAAFGVARIFVANN